MVLRRWEGWKECRDTRERREVKNRPAVLSVMCSCTCSCVHPTEIRSQPDRNLRFPSRPPEGSIVRLTDPSTTTIHSGRVSEQKRETKTKDGPAELVSRRAGSRVFVYLSAQGLQRRLHPGEGHERKTAILFSFLLNA